MSGLRKRSMFCAIVSFAFAGGAKGLGASAIVGVEEAKVLREWLLIKSADRFLIGLRCKHAWNEVQTQTAARCLVTDDLHSGFGSFKGLPETSCCVSGVCV